MSQFPPSSPVPHRSRLLPLALLVSLAGNAAAVGAAVTLWLNAADPSRQAVAIRPPPAGTGGRLPLGRQLKAVLPDAADALVEAALSPHRPTLRIQTRALRAARHGVAEALRAEPFRAEALAAALTTLRAREATLADAAHGGFLDVAAALDGDGRRAVADLVDGRRAARRPE